MGFADGSIVKPDNEDVLAEWKMFDQKASADITLAISPQELGLISECITAYWKQHFNRKGRQEKRHCSNVLHCRACLKRRSNNYSTKISGIGKVCTKVDVRGKQIDLDLENVLHVADLHTNLMSVAKITDKGTS
ncbi:unnamed protein product [Ceratitis capitata]|uniref:(Mediterranean fruit fly) hypothetical protein n=1 Tax=Ceratitis capitata TaxID=7213 RepID=A0A811UP99_CERCA|nr:unnamed protein product [Ceratitis capitata]